mgnify:CR=1 FL=1
MATATLLLAARSRFAVAALPDEVARALGRAERSEHAAGEGAQLQRHFRVQGALDALDATGAATMPASPLPIPLPTPQEPTHGHASLHRSPSRQGG